MKKKGFSIEFLHITGCLLVLLNGLLYLVPSITISGPSGVEMTFSWIDKLGIFTFPIFAFLLVEEVQHTENIKKTAIGLLVLAVAFEIPFDLVHNYRVFDFSLNNQFFTLFLGLAALVLLRKAGNPFLKFAGIAVIAGISCIMDFEYGLGGILMVLLFQATREMPCKRLLQLLGMLVIAWISMRLSLHGIMSMISPGYIPLFGGRFLNAQYLYIGALLPISLYNHRRQFQRDTFLIITYGCLPIAYLGIFLFRYITMGF